MTNGFFVIWMVKNNPLRPSKKNCIMKSFSISNLVAILIAICALGVVAVVLTFLQLFYSVFTAQLDSIAASNAIVSAY